MLVSLYPNETTSRGRAVRQLVGPITRRSRVQIPPPLPKNETPLVGVFYFLDCKTAGFEIEGMIRGGSPYHLRKGIGKPEGFPKAKPGSNPAPATKTIHPLGCCFCIDVWRRFEQERGRENTCFPVAEVMKPRGFIEERSDEFNSPPATKK